MDNVCGRHVLLAFAKSSLIRLSKAPDAKDPSDSSR